MIDDDDEEKGLTGAGGTGRCHRDRKQNVWHRCKSSGPRSVGSASISYNQEHCAFWSDILSILRPKSLQAPSCDCQQIRKLRTQTGHFWPTVESWTKHHGSLSQKPLSRFPSCPWKHAMLRSLQTPRFVMSLTLLFWWKVRNNLPHTHTQGTREVREERKEGIKQQIKH